MSADYNPKLAAYFVIISYSDGICVSFSMKLMQAFVLDTTLTNIESQPDNHELLHNKALLQFSSWGFWLQAEVSPPTRLPPHQAVAVPAGPPGRNNVPRRGQGSSRGKPQVPPMQTPEGQAHGRAPPASARGPRAGRRGGRRPERAALRNSTQTGMLLQLHMLNQLIPGDTYGASCWCRMEVAIYKSLQHL